MLRPTSWHWPMPSSERPGFPSIASETAPRLRTSPGPGSSTRSSASSASPDPEGRRSHAFRVVRSEAILQNLGVSRVHPVRAPDDLERVVERKERAKQVLLVPEAFSVEDPIPRIFGGQEDVVHVNEDPRLQPWEDLEDLIQHVAADLSHMGGVDEQDVVLLQ